ncbi:hypothetical protein DSOL_5179 [Desulfosporosinus metallidurans]|uniref:Uncharacterized protein n=1 Tax=Desulfosporosinus metallidurans TaxID=1888891 RepID=A0A1Q8QEY7_9FIRM|nr:hypothetical protein DSOL_5179 [Desulfosporosinus metallidurans]
MLIGYRLRYKGIYFFKPGYILNLCKINTAADIRVFLITWLRGIKAHRFNILPGVFLHRFHFLILRNQPGNVHEGGGEFCHVLLDVGLLQRFIFTCIVVHSCHNKGAEDGLAVDHTVDGRGFKVGIIGADGIYAVPDFKGGNQAANFFLKGIVSSWDGGEVGLFLRLHHQDIDQWLLILYFCLYGLRYWESADFD